MSYQIPFIQDIQGNTPLDIVFAKFDEQGNEKIPNLNLAWQFFFNIKEYSFLHSGPMVNRVIPIALQHNVPDMDIFLEHRMK